MSEYQYYEFQTVDRPLTEREIEKLRAYSSRATITATRFVNHYNWGDFKGDPQAWMGKYFDAFLYVANWGTHELMLRLPNRVLNLKTARQYCRAKSVSSRPKGDFVILRFYSGDEEGGDWDDDGSGWLSSFLPLRANIAAGDLRALYLAWLLSVQLNEVDEDLPEPSIPNGLQDLSAPLEALADFLRIDRDLITVAAERSSDLHEAGSEKELKAWIGSLPEDDKTDSLVRLIACNDTQTQAELLRRFRDSRPHPSDAHTLEPRTVGELVAAAERHAEERKRKEAERASRKQARRMREEAERRALYLNELAKLEPETWRKIDDLITTKRPADYDEAIRLIRDLTDLAARDGRAAEAAVRIRTLRDQHARKPSFLERLKRASL